MPAKDPDPYPPAIDTYLNKIASKIGGEVTWVQSSDAVYSNFAKTGKSGVSQPFYIFHQLLKGDWMRSSRPDLETVINAGVRLIFS